MSEDTYYPLRCLYCGAEDHTMLQCQKTRPADWKPSPSPSYFSLSSNASLPAPQGVAEVMELVDDYGKRVVHDQECDCIDDREAKRRLSCIEQAITAIMQERDALKARVAELEGDVARDAARYRWLRMQDWFDNTLCVLREPKNIFTGGIILGEDCPSGGRLDNAIDAAIAASKEAP